MARTTLDIDTPILNELKRLQRREGKTLGRLVSDLLAEALGDARRGDGSRRLEWASKSMAARVDVADKDALNAALDRDHE